MTELLILLCEGCLETIALKEGEGFDGLSSCPSCGSSSWLWLSPEQVPRYRGEADVGKVEVGEEVVGILC